VSPKIRIAGSKRTRMKIASLISRILLGLIFVVFGLNGFLHFIPGPLPPGLAGQFVGALIQSHYVFLVAGVQIISGALMLVNRYIPLAIVLSGAVIANILMFHICLLPSQSLMAVLVAIFWIIIFIYHRQQLSCLFVQRS
jgi:putative oxidoreductase